MIKYVIILLDRTSTAFCYANNPYEDKQLISINILKDAIRWSMKENLRIQFVYPDYELPETHLSVINSIDHAEIKHNSDADVTVINGWEEYKNIKAESPSIVIRLTKKDIFDNPEYVHGLLECNGHVSVVIKDVVTFTQEDMHFYHQLISDLSQKVVAKTINGKIPKINILTDRSVLLSMNNCNAGNESITIAHNGNFYICPSFFYENEDDCVGNLKEGLNIKNGQLYKLAYAPICRLCDAYQCRRCIWLNRKTTLEVNTPSHEQCVISHIERNASRKILNDMRNYVELPYDMQIEELDYLDPFEKLIRK